MRIQQHQPNTPNLKSPQPHKPAEQPTAADRVTRSTELQDYQYAKIIVPRVALATVAGAGVGALVSSLPSVMEVAAPGAGYLAAGVMGLGVFGGLSAGASISPVAGVLMAGGMGFAALACFNNASAVGQVLLSPPVMGIVGAFAGVAAVAVHLARSKPEA